MGIRTAKEPTPCPKCGDQVLVCEDSRPSTGTVAHSLMGRKPDALLLDPKLIPAVVRHGRDGRDAVPREVHQAHVCNPKTEHEKCSRCGSTNSATLCGSCWERASHL